jgi:hypothetical protein
MKAPLATYVTTQIYFDAKITADWVRRLRRRHPGPAATVRTGFRQELSDQTTNISGFHISTFNELERTEVWRRPMLARTG